MRSQSGWGSRKVQVRDDVMHALREDGDNNTSEMHSVGKDGPRCVEPDAWPKVTGSRQNPSGWMKPSLVADWCLTALPVAAADMKSRQVRFMLPAVRIVREFKRDFELLRAMRARSWRVVVRLSRQTAAPMECEEGVMASPCFRSLCCTGGVRDNAAHWPTLGPDS